ncbi:MAG: 7-cyano-7-deazaguanine synthase, partial [Acidimicrobiales bacterium]
MTPGGAGGRPPVGDVVVPSGDAVGVACLPAAGRPPVGDVVVLSGGLDSTVCLALAAAQGAGGRPLMALTFDYGQRHRVELGRAAAVAGHFGAEQLVVRLDTAAWGGSALTDPAIDVPPAQAAPAPGPAGAAGSG